MVIPRFIMIPHCLPDAFLFLTRRGVHSLQQFGIRLSPSFFVKMGELLVDAFDDLVEADFRHSFLPSAGSSGKRPGLLKKAG